MSNDIISIANEIATEKENIRLAIVAQGVACDTSTPLEDYPGKIASIQGSVTTPEALWEDEMITDETTTYTVNSGIGIVGGDLFKPAKSSLETVDFNNVSTVGKETCKSCTALTEFSGSSLTYIADSAFMGCYNLSDVSNSTVERIDDAAFSGCYNITTGISSISFPLVEYVGANSFYNNQLLQSVSLPQCKKIGANAFKNCGNQIYSTSSINISYNLSLVEYIGASAFHYSLGLATITLPKCKYIGPSAFYYNTALTNVSLHDCEYLGDECFRNCTGTLTLSNCSNIKHIGDYCFYDSNIDKINSSISGTINLPNCEFIGSYAFYNRENITDVTIKDGCVISDKSFYRDANSEGSITLTGKPSKILDSAFFKKHFTTAPDFSICTEFGPSCCQTYSGNYLGGEKFDFSAGPYFDNSRQQAYVFKGYGTSTNRIKVWLPKTCTCASTSTANTYKIFTDCYLEVYTDAASSSELPIYPAISNNTPTYHWGTTHEDFLNA